ncbi:hypothetical protein JCM21900_000340, partial [Sporobolomyces salmonicolor]
SISWEIALPFIATLIFLILVEAWKFAKRVYIRHRQVEEEEDDGIFASWKTTDPSQEATLVV